MRLESETRRSGRLAQQPPVGQRLLRLGSRHRNGKTWRPDESPNRKLGTLVEDWSHTPHRMRSRLGFRSRRTGTSKKFPHDRQIWESIGGQSRLFPI